MAKKEGASGSSKKVKLPSDEAGRLKSGDSDAWTRQMDQQRPGMFRRLRMMGYEPDDAEDLVQGTFKRAWEAIHTWGNKGEYDFGGWVFRIMYNQSFDTRRRRRASEIQLDEHIARPELLGHVEEEVVVRNKQQCIRQAISELPTYQAYAIWQHHLQGKSTAEIAVEIGKSEGAVKSLIHRGLKTLAGDSRLRDAFED